MKTHNLRKGDRLVYRSYVGRHYSARVLRAHRDETLTIQLHFMLDDSGKDSGLFQGIKYRIGRANIVAAFGDRS